MKTRPRRCSTFGTPPKLLLWLAIFLLWCLAMPRHPLRLIISRFPVFFELAENYQTYCFLDTLECGHQVYVYPQSEDVNQKRHRCVECGRTLAKKKPSSSVEISLEKRRKA